MTIRDALIDELLAGEDPAPVLRQDGLLGTLKKALLDRLMSAEFDSHMAHEAEAGGRNHRNGTTRKRVTTDGHPSHTCDGTRDSTVEVTTLRNHSTSYAGGTFDCSAHVIVRRASILASTNAVCPASMRR